MSERLLAYRKTERMSNSSLQEVLSELSELEDMTPLGKTLVATKEDNPQQRWRDCMRVFIEGRSRKEGWRKGQSQQDKPIARRAADVIEGMTKEHLALAIEWVMGRQSGLELIGALTREMTNKEDPCNTVAEVFKRATKGCELQQALAKDLLE